MCIKRCISLFFFGFASLGGGFGLVCCEGTDFRDFLMSAGLELWGVEGVGLWEEGFAFSVGQVWLEV